MLLMRLLLLLITNICCFKLFLPFSLTGVFFFFLKQNYLFIIACIHLIGLIIMVRKVFILLFIEFQPLIAAAIIVLPKDEYPGFRATVSLPQLLAVSRHTTRLSCSFILQECSLFQS